MPRTPKNEKPVKVKPSSLRVTDNAMQSMIKTCRAALPSEACGFLVAQKENPGLGTRVVWMQNMDPNPAHGYSMDENALRHVYQEFDLTHEEPVAVFHSHPTSEPIMSDRDLREARDTSLAYLIVSLAQSKPQVRAYQVQAFIGTATAQSIPIDVTASPAQSIPLRTHSGPWALTPGNRVRITYIRQGVKAASTCVAWVTGLTPEVVQIDPDHKTSPRMIPFVRIQAVHVLEECLAAERFRLELRTHARQASALLDWPDVRLLPEICHALRRAFPSGIMVSMEKK